MFAIPQIFHTPACHLCHYTNLYPILLCKLLATLRPTHIPQHIALLQGLSPCLLYNPIAHSSCFYSLTRANFTHCSKIIYFSPLSGILEEYRMFHYLLLQCRKNLNFYLLNKRINTKKIKSCCMVIFAE